jgi:hypothetical protein
MVEESKDGGPHGFEEGHSVKLLVHRLFNHSDAKLCHFCYVYTKLNNPHLERSKKVASLKLVLQSVINIGNRCSDH